MINVQCLACPLLAHHHCNELYITPDTIQRHFILKVETHGHIHKKQWVLLADKTPSKIYLFLFFCSTMFIAANLKSTLNLSSQIFGYGST